MGPYRSKSPRTLFVFPATALNLSDTTCSIGERFFFNDESWVKPTGVGSSLTVNEPWVVSVLGYGRGISAPGRFSDHTRSLEGDSPTEHVCRSILLSAFPSIH